MKVLQKKVYILSALLSVSVILPITGAGQQAATIKKVIGTIVLDPGHGGKDPGTVYGKLYEKDIVLDVALMLGKKIQDNYPQIKVIYTRSTDNFIDLWVRGDIANKAKADLFLSIHVNAAKDAKARGTETFIMGIDKQNSNLELAMRENSVISMEEDYTAKYEGFLPNDPDSYIIFSLMQYANSGQSIQLASSIQKHYCKDTQLPERGAKMAPYLVLWRTTMPSVLTELGFITNEDDRKFISSKAGKERLATSLFNAFSEYKAAVEGKSNPVMLAVAPSEGPENAATPEQTTETPSDDGRYYFCVQLCSSQKKVPKNSAVFKEYRGQVKERIIDGRYKYFHGDCNSYAEAQELQSKVRKSIKDAFLVAFRDDQLVSVSEARKKLK